MRRTGRLPAGRRHALGNEIEATQGPLQSAHTPREMAAIMFAVKRLPVPCVIGV